MRARTTGLAVSAGLAVALLGCGQAALIDSHGRATPVSVRASPAVTASPAMSSPAAAATTPAPAPASSTPGTMVDPSTTMTFAIMPLFAAGAAGTIAVRVAGGVAHYHAVVTGLAPHSTHTIHDHAGSCAGGLGSRHLSVLAVATADAHGVIVFDATVPSGEFGAGRIVLVYQSARASVIAGCATL